MGREPEFVKRIALIAEYDPDFAPHTATDAAIRHSSTWLGSSVAAEWVSTTDLTARTTCDRSMGYGSHRAHRTSTWGIR